MVRRELLCVSRALCNQFFVRRPRILLWSLFSVGKFVFEASVSHGAFAVWF